MSQNAVAIAADHAGFALKESLKSALEARGVEVVDLGTDGPDSVDYPDFAEATARAVIDGRAGRGVLICGSGVGMSIAANRHPGIRAALCQNADMARLSREHNDANILVLGARNIEIGAAEAALETFLNTPFAGGRHQRRVAKLG